MQLVAATQDHLPSWLALRRRLWPHPDAHHLQEMQEILASPSMIAFLLFDDDGQPIGFIEGAIYLTVSQKYGYVEGWYVLPDRRQQGWGGHLLSALEQWILHQSITLVLSDTIPAVYPLSARAHMANGFEELMTIQVFVKQLDANGRAVS